MLSEKHLEIASIHEYMNLISKAKAKAICKVKALMISYHLPISYQIVLNNSPYEKKL